MTRPTEEETSSAKTAASGLRICRAVRVSLFVLFFGYIFAYFCPFDKTQAPNLRISWRLDDHNSKTSAPGEDDERGKLKGPEYAIKFSRHAQPSHYHVHVHMNGKKNIPKDVLDHTVEEELVRMRYASGSPASTRYDETEGDNLAPGTSEKEVHFYHVHAHMKGNKILPEDAVDKAVEKELVRIRHAPDSRSSHDEGETRGAIKAPESPMAPTKEVSRVEIRGHDP
mmetsp:Transcript_13837/g.32178  ORF Transcript_13837/g.32178 Transcript_13837/m.32178 type:complete len:226 (-) Transcript_13837:178-855(-)